MRLSTEAQAIMDSLQTWVQTQQGRLLVRRSHNLMLQGNVAGAIAALTEALSKHLKPEEIYLRRGQAHWHQQNAAAALEDFSHAIALCPHDPRPYQHRGIVYYSLGEDDKAQTDWDIALYYQPDNAIARYYRGLLALEQGRHSDALVDFDHALHKNPLMAEAYYHRGHGKYALGDVEGAIADWELALCNDLRLDEAREWLLKVQHQIQSHALTQALQAVLPAGVELSLQHRGDRLTLELRRQLGVPINYFTLPDTLRHHLIQLQPPGVRSFHLIAYTGDSTLAEWNQTYGIYDRVPCPPARWQMSVLTTLLLFPPFGILSLLCSAQVKASYQRGDYPTAMRASRTVKKLCLSSGAVMGMMLFFLASYGVYTNVEVHYPNPAAKTAMLPKADSEVEP